MQGMTKKQLLDRLNMFLAARAEEDVFTVLIVDEAQNIPTTLLEQLRLLSNLETAKKKLLQIIFVGQLELDQKLKTSSLRQLNQRISVRFETKTLSPIDTEHYIRHRLAVAGASSRLQFGSGAFKAIWRHSKGYPRLINLICDRALLAGYTERSPVITRKLVRKAAASLKGKDIETTQTTAEWNWARRLMPYFVAVIVLIAALCLLIASGIVRTQ
jgi:general secretion pathway protein A